MSRIEYNNLKPYMTLRNIVLILLFFMPILVTFVIFFTEDSAEFSHMGNASYQALTNYERCAPDTRSGDTGASYGESTQGDIKYNIRTPLNYDATIAHPLIMVFAPAGANRAKTEKMTNLTYAATSAGFIIAYADHPELSTTTTIDLGTIPDLIAKKWCIDNNRVFLTGHSDGGTAAMALAFMAGTKHIPAAIAPSAAGINDADLRDHECPGPLPVMVMHSGKDRLFPGYGIESSGWWAACNNCDPIPDNMDNGCIAYNGCDNGVTTWYCEGSETHSRWSGMNDAIIDFFILANKKIH